MASMYDDLIIAAIGPNYWNHDLTNCQCDIEAPEDPDAYMTHSCLENYHTGAIEQVTRGRALQELCEIITKQAQRG